MTDIRAFIGKRRPILQRELDDLLMQHREIQGKIDVVRRELAELERAAKTIGIVNGLAEASPSRRKPSVLTLKAATMEILKDFPGGLTALDILKEINERYALGAVRTSLSPQLSRLKQSGLIKNSGVVWSLTQPRFPNAD